LASSIMSKKLAEGISGLLLDVKCGSGAFMKDIGSARLLAQTLVRIGNAMSVGCRAFITNMNQPIGWAVGNALEIKESIEILKGGGPADTLELVVAFGGWMLHAGGKAESEEHGAEMIRDAIADGSGAEIFKRLIKAQGGNPEIVDNPDLMPSAVHEHEFKAEDEGYIESFDAEAMGMALVLLGGGRLKKEDSIDPSVGFRVHKKIGDFAKKGDAIFTVYYNDERKLEDSLAKLKGCVKFSPKNPDFTLILEKFE
ncbi:MAG: pyrimidine-nucleoside phosphorylase, partial [Deltaproteobacteria bacterium]|nr:pyrimidine-nucleoside phosphorylase [Deltaproteobacteria bacterium]